MCDLACRDRFGIRLGKSDQSAVGPIAAIETSGPLNGWDLGRLPTNGFWLGKVEMQSFAIEAHPNI